MEHAILARFRSVEFRLHSSRNCVFPKTEKFERQAPLCGNQPLTLRENRYHGAARGSGATFTRSRSENRTTNAINCIHLVWPVFLSPVAGQACNCPPGGSTKPEIAPSLPTLGLSMGKVAGGMPQAPPQTWGC